MAIGSAFEGIVGSSAATDFKPYLRALWQESIQVHALTEKEVENSPQKK